MIPDSERTLALELAIRLYGHTDTDSSEAVTRAVIATATVFERYLRGDERETKAAEPPAP